MHLLSTNVHTTPLMALGQLQLWLSGADQRYGDLPDAKPGRPRTCESGDFMVPYPFATLAQATCQVNTNGSVAVMFATIRRRNGGKLWWFVRRCRAYVAFGSRVRRLNNSNLAPALSPARVAVFQRPV